MSCVCVLVYNLRQTPIAFFFAQRGKDSFLFTYRVTVHNTTRNTSAVKLVGRHWEILDANGVLQCVAVCCSVLQCVAVCCSVLQSISPSLAYERQVC